MLFGIDLLLALGVVLATAATDAVPMSCSLRPSLRGVACLQQPGAAFGTCCRHLR